MGVMWYSRTVIPPKSWKGRRIRLRLGAAAHKQEIYCNGKLAGSHKGGFLPVDVDVTDSILPGQMNELVIRLDSRLDWSTLPPGVEESVGDFPSYQVPARQRYFHDFFNYSGIHRSVQLYATEMVAIRSIRCHTVQDAGAVFLAYSVASEGNADSVKLTLRDRHEEIVSEAQGAEGLMRVKQPVLWKPGKPYLYTLEVRHPSSDIYRLRTGLRWIEVDETSLLINGEPFYFRGFGKHEDADIIGKGHSDAIMVRDFNLIDWIGANSFRTSHYPYAEEILEYADERGVVVIGELPAVGFNFSPAHSPFFVNGKVDEVTQQHHLQALEEMFIRDSYHPSIVCWSLANEASTQEPASRRYFEPIVKRARDLDRSRPLMLVMSAFPENDHVGDLFDILGVNRYYGWYHDVGDLDSVIPNLSAELLKWYERYRKPIVMTEYGVDAVAGLHRNPPCMFSEEFQCEYLDRVHQVLDKLDFVTGEHVWNFADFATAEGLKRVGGNCKGVFTRQRQPKMAAYHLRDRWQGR